MSEAISWPTPTGERVSASVDVTEKFFTCSLPAPTRQHPHRVVNVRIRASRDLLGGQWSIEVADLSAEKVNAAFPHRLWSQEVHPDMVDQYAMRLAQRIVHVLWLYDRSQELASEVADDWRSADIHRQEATA